MITLPFNLGDTYWLPHFTPRQVSVSCPLCGGATRVTLICHDDTHYDVECTACDQSYGRPTGTILQYDHTPTAVEFIIARVVGMRDGQWEVESTTGAITWFNALYPTEASALAVATTRAAEHQERVEMQRAYRRRQGGQVAWNVRYANERIKEAERTIAWHTARARAVGKRVRRSMETPS